MAARDYEDEEYKKFRKAVRKRDKHKCKICGSAYTLQVHHILPWAYCPHLRFDVSNGITLCKSCHKNITGNEAIWVDYLSSLIK